MSSGFGFLYQTVSPCVRQSADTVASSPRPLNGYKNLNLVALVLHYPASTARAAFVPTMHDTDILLPAKPQASKPACILVVLILFIIALSAIAVVNWKVGRGVPISHRSIGGGHHRP